MEAPGAKRPRDDAQGQPSTDQSPARKKRRTDDGGAAVAINVHGAATPDNNGRRRRGLHGWYSHEISEKMGSLAFLDDQGRRVRVTCITVGPHEPMYSEHVYVGDLEYVGLLQLRLHE
jgi:hypothetical protein